MLEYLNYGALGFIGFIIILTHIISKERPLGMYTILIILLGMSFYDANSKYSTALQNIQDFTNQNHTLKCISGGGLYSAGNSYRVSISHGWEVDKHYFIKDSLSVAASSCQRW